jgi:ribonucleoside-diphosphate reductase alpha chain
MLRDHRVRRRALLHRPADGKLAASRNAYERRSRTRASSSPSRDDLVNEVASWTSGRARRGSSSTAPARGTNFSALRGENEPLSGGGKSSGLMSFLKIGDRAAGAIKSGGTTRRAAKMVCLDLDHPDIESSSRGR